MEAVTMALTAPDETGVRRIAATIRLRMGSDLLGGAEGDAAHMHYSSLSFGKKEDQKKSVGIEE
jgi:hypothetical protein